jgi:hypothetical protein
METLNEIFRIRKFLGPNSDQVPEYEIRTGRDLDHNLGLYGISLPGNAVLWFRVPTPKKFLVPVPNPDSVPDPNPESDPDHMWQLFQKIWKKSCLFNVSIISQKFVSFLFLNFLTFVFQFMLEPDPNPDSEYTTVPVPLRQKICGSCGSGSTTLHKC